MLLQTTGVAVAQRQLRHSDASTTLDHYGHILGNDHREAVKADEAALSCLVKTDSKEPVGDVSVLRLARFWAMWITSEQHQGPGPPIIQSAASSLVNSSDFGIIA